jgi:hypothetical protein
VIKGIVIGFAICYNIMKTSNSRLKDYLLINSRTTSVTHCVLGT